MKSASASGSAGSGIRPENSHHAVNAFQSPRYALRVFREEAAAANPLAESEMAAGETWEPGMDSPANGRASIACELR